MRTRSAVRAAVRGVRPAATAPGRSARGARAVLVGAVLAGAVLAGALVAGCDEQPAVTPPSTAAASSPAAGGTPSAPPPVPAGVALPDGALRPLVPAPDEVPSGLVPLLQASGPRDASAVADFSADPAAARAQLAADGFTEAYVVQYASPTDTRSLTVVVSRFASPGGARRDYEADVAQEAGTATAGLEPVGDATSVRRLHLPGNDVDELVTVRVRRAGTTWLVAWREPRPADPGVPLELARRLAAR